MSPSMSRATAPTPMLCQSGLRDDSTTELTGLTIRAGTASRQLPAQPSMKFLAMPAPMLKRSLRPCSQPARDSCRNKDKIASDLALSSLVRGFVDVQQGLEEPGGTSSHPWPRHRCLALFADASARSRSPEEPVARAERALIPNPGREAIVDNRAEGARQLVPNTWTPCGPLRE